MLESESSECLSVSSSDGFSCNGKKIIYSADYRAKQILGNLYNNCKTGEGCDVKLIVEGKEYPAHKIILTELSSYFKAMFFGNFVESEQLKVKLDLIETSAMKIILDFAYASDIIITCQNVHQVLRAAHLLQISKLVDVCIKFVVQSIDPKSCFETLAAAKLYMDSDHKKSVQKYLLGHFREVCQEEKFLEVDAENLIEMLKDENLVVDNEDQVFEAVMRWFLFDQEERTPFLDKVLSHVRLAHVGSNLLKEHLENFEALQTSNVYQLIQNQTNSQLLKAEMDASFTRRRSSWPVEALILSVRHHVHCTMEVCITESGEIVRTRTFDSLRGDEMLALERYSRVLSYGKDIAALLGNTTKIYDRYSGKWKKACRGILPSLKQTGVVYVNGDWYFIGGLYRNCSSKNVYRYNAATKMGQTLDRMPKPVSKATVVYFHGMIYVFGGCCKYKFHDISEDDSSDSLRSRRRDLYPDSDDVSDYSSHRVIQVSYNVLRYDIDNESWEELCDVPSGCEVVGACVLNERIFVFVRKDSSKPKKKKLKASTEDDRQVYNFNPTTTEWESCGDLNHKYVSGPVVFKNAMYVVSERKADLSKTRFFQNGYRRSREHTTSCLERYSPAADAWLVFADFPGFEVDTIFGPLPIRCLGNQNDVFGLEEEEKIRLRLL